jgi:hypothetical protein
MSTVTKLVEEVRIEFLSSSRDLLALTKNGVNDAMRRVAAAMSLDTQAQENVLLYADAVDQSGFAGEVARADFKREMYRATCVAFLRVQRNCVIEFVSRLTPEALTQLEDIEIAAGQRTPRPVVAPPPPPKSAAEQLEDQVIADYNGALSTDKMRAKMNSNVAYRNTFNRLSENGKLESRVTTLHDGGRL